MRLPRRAVHAAASSAPKAPFCDHCERNLAPLPAYICCAHAACNNLAICVDCFSVGAADRLPHRPNHPYRVIEKTAQPLFHPDWQASEEYRLLSAMSHHGPNHWKPVSEYVGKGMIKCQNHYESVYLQPTSSSLPFPVSLLYHEQQSAATTRAARNPASSEPAAPPSLSPTPCAAPAAQHPPASNHSPCTPRRDDFEVEWDDGAEHLIADLNIDSHHAEQPALNVLEHFNARLQRRYAVKDYLMEGDILCFSEDASSCLRQEQNLSNRLYALSWLLDSARFKAFYHSVMSEFRRAKTMYMEGRRQKAKRKARDLDANGKSARSKTNVAKRRRTNKARSTPFSKRKRSSAKKQHECPPSPVADATMPNTPASAPASPNSAASPSLLAHLQPVQPSPAFLRKAKQLRRAVSSESAPPAPKPVDGMEDASQLSPAERNLCAALHIPPTFFLEMKSVTLLTVTALQQIRRNDKQSSSDRIVVPPANFAQDLDQADEQSGSSAKKDAAHEEKKDSLVLPPLTLPKVVNNHVLFNSDEQVEEQGSPAQNKCEASQEMDQELLDFLTHIPEDTAECASLDVKKEPAEVEGYQGGHDNGQLLPGDVAKMGLVKKEDTEMELVKEEDALLDERSVIRHDGVEVTDGNGPVLVQCAQEEAAPRPVEAIEKTSTSSGSFPLSSQPPSYSSGDGARQFIPTSTANGSVSATIHKERGHEELTTFSGEDAEPALQDPKQRAVQGHPGAPLRQTVYLRLSLREPRSSSPNVAGGVNTNPCRTDQSDMMHTSGQAPHGPSAGAHGFDEHAATALTGGDGKGTDLSNGMRRQGRVYLRTSIHQPMRGVEEQIPRVNPPRVSNVDESHARSHLQLPQSMARFGNLYLPPPGQRERPDNNATRAERRYPQQGTRTYLVPNRNARGFEFQTAPIALGFSQDGQAAVPALQPHTDAGGGGRVNEPGPLASMGGQAMGMPSINATVRRVYLKPQPLPPAPDNPNVVVEPQPVNVGGHDARFQNEDSTIVPAPPERETGLPPLLTRIPVEGFDAGNPGRVSEWATGSANTDGDFRTDGTAGPQDGCPSLKGEGRVGSECKPDNPVGEASNPPPTQGSREEQDPSRVEGAGDDPGSEIEEILLDEGKAETDDGEGSDCAPESPSSSEGQSESKPGNDDPDYEPSFGSFRGPSKGRRVGARSGRRGKARANGRRARSSDHANRKHPQAEEESEEIVSEGGGAESDDFLHVVEDQERGTTRKGRSLRTRRASLPASAAMPTRRSSRIQRRSRRLTDHSPDPRPRKKRQLTSLRGSQAPGVATNGVSVTENVGISIGDGQGKSPAVATTNGVNTRNSVTTRGMRKSGDGNDSTPRRSSGRIVRKTRKAKELEIVTPQIDPQSATLSSDSSDSIRLIPPSGEQGSTRTKYGLRRKWSS